MGKDSGGWRPDDLSTITREFEAMTDWELERGCAASLGFNLDRRIVANRILRKRYSGPSGALRSGHLCCLR
jgi:hypothetical protein